NVLVDDIHPEVRRHGSLQPEYHTYHPDVVDGAVSLAPGFGQVGHHVLDQGGRYRRDHVIDLPFDPSRYDRLDGAVGGNDPLDRMRETKRCPERLDGGFKCVNEGLASPLKVAKLFLEKRAARPANTLYARPGPCGRDV